MSIKEYLRRSGILVKSAGGRTYNFIFREIYIQEDGPKPKLKKIYIQEDGPKSKLNRKGHSLVSLGLIGLLVLIYLGTRCIATKNVEKWVEEGLPRNETLEGQKKNTFIFSNLPKLIFGGRDNPNPGPQETLLNDINKLKLEIDDLNRKVLNANNELKNIENIEQQNIENNEKLADELAKKLLEGFAQQENSENESPPQNSSEENSENESSPQNSSANEVKSGEITTGDDLALKNIISELNSLNERRSNLSKQINENQKTIKKKENT